jgi:hypothetical protein
MDYGRGSYNREYEGEVTTDGLWAGGFTTDGILAVTTDGISGRQASKQVHTKGVRADGRKE